MELLTAYVVASDKGAFAALMARHKRIVRGACGHVRYHRQDVEEVSLDVFLALIRKAPALQPDVSFGGSRAGTRLEGKYSIEPAGEGTKDRAARIETMWDRSA